jgi:hypothetical protein
MRTLTPKKLTVGLLAVLLLASVVLPSAHASALSGSQFNAGNIIDVSVFFNPNTINAGDIQNFLNAKVPTCDTNGTQPSGHAGYPTRASWGAANGYPAPYTCIKDYSLDEPAKAPDAYCGGGITAGHKSAAQVIFDVSQACSVNPKVLLVLLQKEQSLVTDDWPWPIEYQSATGYGCPDTAPCSSEYYGLFNQLYNAAHQFQRYAKEPQNFNFAAGRTSNIQYNPMAPPACGNPAVNIQNSATAALYNYTPYQPNPAALANLYGTGDSCSAYGNRNFWRMYNDWFGDTHSNTQFAWQRTGVQINSDAARTQAFSGDTTVAPGGKVYVRVTGTNIGNYTWDQTSFRLGTTSPIDRVSPFYDPATWINNTRPTRLLQSSVPPGGSATFEFDLLAPSTPGQYTESFNPLAENISWMNDLNTSITINVVAPAAPNTSNNNILASGATLAPGSYLLSPDGESALTLQTDGNMVLYSNFKAVWNTVTFNRTPNRLEMGTDGNLKIYFSDGSTWASNTAGHPGAYLKLQTDGNLVIYDTNGTPLWNTVTFQSPDHLSYVNTTLSGNTMLPGQQLETADRHYKLIFQTDGNLVLYSETTGRALWNSVSFNKGGKFLTQQNDGNLVIYTANGTAIWNSQTNGRGVSQLTLQQDGNLVLYNGVGKYPWNTATFNQN